MQFYHLASEYRVPLPIPANHELEALSISLINLPHESELQREGSGRRSQQVPRLYQFHQGRGIINGELLENKLVVCVNLET